MAGGLLWNHNRRKRATDAPRNCLLRLALHPNDLSTALPALGYNDFGTWEQSRLLRSRQISRRFTGNVLKDSPEGQRPAQSCCPACARTRQLGTDLDLPAFAVSAERDASADKQALDSGADSCTTPPERGGYEQQPRFMSPDYAGLL